MGLNTRLDGIAETLSRLVICTGIGWHALFWHRMLDELNLDQFLEQILSYPAPKIIGKQCRLHRESCNRDVELLGNNNQVAGIFRGMGEGDAKHPAHGLLVRKISGIFKFYD